MAAIKQNQLAKALNLTVASVSRALRDSPEISPQTKERVCRLAAELKYQPNAYASRLRRHVSQTIAVVIPKVTNHFFALVINGIEEVARQNGFHVLICLTHDDYAREAAILQHLGGGRADGLLLSLASGTQSFAHLRAFVETDLPIVFFDHICAEIPTSPPATTKVAAPPPNTCWRQAAAPSRTCLLPARYRPAGAATRATSTRCTPTASAASAAKQAHPNGAARLGALASLRSQRQL